MKERRLYLELGLCNADVYTPVVQKVTQLSQGQVRFLEETVFPDADTDSSPTLFRRAPPDDTMANATVLAFFHDAVASRTRYVNSQQTVTT